MCVSLCLLVLELSSRVHDLVCLRSCTCALTISVQGCVRASAYEKRCKSTRTACIVSRCVGVCTRTRVCAFARTCRPTRKRALSSRGGVCARVRARLCARHGAPEDESLLPSYFVLSKQARCRLAPEHWAEAGLSETRAGTYRQTESEPHS